MQTPDDDDVNTGPGQSTEGDEEDGSPAHVGEHILNPVSPSVVRGFHNGVAPLNAGMLGQTVQDALDKIKNH